MNPEAGSVESRLNELLLQSGQLELGPGVGAKFESYLGLLLRWNARTNLTAIRDEDGILRRHFLESIACARAIPAGTGTLLDFGSGAGFPGLPVALCRREIAVTLAESQNKKATFLREAARVLEIPIRVHGGRAEDIGRVFECVTLRAVDRLDEAVRAAANLVAATGWLGVLTTRGRGEGIQSSVGPEFSWERSISLDNDSERVLVLGRRM